MPPRAGRTVAAKPRPKAARSTPKLNAKVRNEYEFGLAFRFDQGVEELDDAMVDALFEAGCDDALVAVRCGEPYITFSREAPSFRVALFSAIADVERSGVGLELVRVEPV